MSVGFQQPADGDASRKTPGGVGSGSELLESSNHQLKLEKSNILMLGPTGSGKSPCIGTLKFNSLEQFNKKHVGIEVNARSHYAAHLVALVQVNFASVYLPYSSRIRW